MKFTKDKDKLNLFINICILNYSLFKGPPGTGKTYLGLKLVKFLFANQQFWAPSTNYDRFRFDLHYDDDDKPIRRPMLVVCYTNHALDQFLEGMIPFLKGTGIVRVGGRCKNEELDKWVMLFIKKNKIINNLFLKYATTTIIIIILDLLT